MPPDVAEAADAARGREAAGISEPLARFRLTDRGVEKRTDDGWRWVCSSLRVLALSRNVEGREWGRLVEIIDRDGNVHVEAMPMRQLAGDGTDFIGTLLAHGLDIAPSKGAKTAVIEYLVMSRTDEMVRCVPRAGWHGGAYVMADGTSFAGETTERMVLQMDSPNDHAFRVGGTEEAWRDLARLAVGNTRLALALSAAFVGPLLAPCRAEGGGLHFRGGSSTGKTTLLRLAGSVWGGGGQAGFIRNWRSTANGMETAAMAHSDALLALDEIGQLDAKEAAVAAYLLSNGQGKQRASRNGAGRPVAEWRLLFLSTGEQSLESKIEEAGPGKRSFAGQQVRVVDVPADAGRERGVFEELHNFSGAGALARHISVEASRHYGHGARAFIEAIAGRLVEVEDTVSDHVKDFVSDHCPDGADGQVSRVAARFGLVAAAGELATALDVLPWPKGEATAAAARCFFDWLAERGGTNAGEEIEAVRRVRTFVSLHGSTRFEGLGDLAPRDATGAPIELKVLHRVGFRRREQDSEGVEYIVLPDTWRSEICAGIDPKIAAKALAAAGHLLMHSDGRPTVKIRLPGFSGLIRCYVIRSSILGDAEPLRDAAE